MIDKFMCPSLHPPPPTNTNLATALYQGSIHDAQKRRVSCIIIHARGTLKYTQYIHEVDGFFNSIDSSKQKPHKQIYLLVWSLGLGLLV